jgi:HSP20 family protein
MNQESTSRRGGGYGMVPRSTGLPTLFGSGGPFALLQQLDEDMNRLFDEFGVGSIFRPSSQQGGGANPWSPQLEVYQRDNKLHVCADLPGLKREDIKVDLDEGRLTIQGERHSQNVDDQRGERQQQGGYYRSERSYGSFYRSLPLPEGIDVDSAQASFRDGVLDITFDAPPNRASRRRTLQIGEGTSSSPQPKSPMEGKVASE